MKDLTHQKISINPKKTVAQCTLFSKCPQCFFESLTTFILYSLDKLELAQFNFADFLHFSLNFDDISIHRKKICIITFLLFYNFDFKSKQVSRLRYNVLSHFWFDIFTTVQVGLEMEKRKKHSPSYTSLFRRVKKLSQYFNYVYICKQSVH